MWEVCDALGIMPGRVSPQLTQASIVSLGGKKNIPLGGRKSSLRVRPFLPHVSTSFNNPASQWLASKSSHVFLHYYF
jgi:hypothetical protein